jgi:hypothetical protein
VRTYSCAVLRHTWKILSNALPFRAIKTSSALMRAVLSGERPPHIPSSSSTALSYSPIWSICDKLWGEDPAMRPVAQDTSTRLDGLELSLEDIQGGAVDQ